MFLCTWQTAVWWEFNMGIVVEKTKSLSESQWTVSDMMDEKMGGRVST